MASSSQSSSSPDTPEISITLTHRGSSHTLSSTIQRLTDVSIHHQKLLYKGKKTSHTTSSEATVQDVGLKDGVKVMLVGGTNQEVGGMQREEDEARRRERIDRERRAKPQTKLRSTGAPSSQNQYKFHSIKPHPLLPESPAALAVLIRLSEDPAIQHVMQVHHFSVGLLTEFAPHEHPDKLGYNMNAGQCISLRIRTNLYDGFRPYLDIRKVLLHELTHNVWGDHDNNFKELNSKLNREVLEHEHTLIANTHTLSSSPSPFGTYTPSSELEGEATSFILGGYDSSLRSGGRDESREERRRRMLEATMARLRKEEEELEGACGTDGHGPSTSAGAS